METWISVAISLLALSVSIVTAWLTFLKKGMLLMTQPTSIFWGPDGGYFESIRPFYLENDQRISLRGKILREIISNLLIHREYTNAFPAKFIIERAKILTENGNKPHGFGLINPERLTPYPKNPSIARVFKEIGKADELGSGTRNLFKYCRVYCGHDPQLLEEDIFKFILPLIGQATPQATPQDERTKRILEFCQTPRNREEIQEYLGLKDREHFRLEILQPLLEQGLLQPTIPDKLTSPKQKYYSLLPGKKA